MRIQKGMESVSQGECYSQHLRSHILSTLDPYDHPGPLTISIVYIWPSRFCSVGCGHCNFASSPIIGLSREQDSFHSADAQVRLVEFINQLNVWKVVLSGGGEPLLEPATVERVIENVQSERLEEIEVITSGIWGKTLKSSERILNRLMNAHRRRSQSCECETKFLLRLSVDWFHRQSMGLTPIENIIQTLDSRDFADIHCYIRSVLLVGDSTIHDLAASLHADLSPLTDYQQTLTLPSGRSILVYYKNLIIDGRLNQETLSSLPVQPSSIASAAQFSKRCRESSGRFIPGLTYNGPKVHHLDGLNLTIEYDGSVKILEATAPDNVPSLYENDWQTARAMLYSDPLTIYLLEDGPEEFIKIMQEIRADSMYIGKNTNQLYYIVDKLLNTPDERLWATVKVLQMHRERGRLNFADDLLQDAIQYLERKYSRN